MLAKSFVTPPHRQKSLLAFSQLPGGWMLPQDQLHTDGIIMANLSRNEGEFSESFMSKVYAKK